MRHLAVTKGPTTGQLLAAVPLGLAQQPQSESAPIHIAELTAVQLLALQKTVGNRAVSLLIAKQEPLQRSCGCGGTCGSCEPDEDYSRPAVAQRDDGGSDQGQTPDAGSGTGDGGDTGSANAGGSSGLIVDDDTQDVGFTQMKKSDFVGQARSAVQTAVSVVPGVDADAANADLDKRTELATQQKAADLEADIKSQVPGASLVPIAMAYIPLIASFAAAQAASAGPADGGVSTPATGPELGGSGAATVVARQACPGAEPPRLWSGWDGPVRLKSRDGIPRPAGDLGVMRARLGDGAGLGGAQAPMEAAFGTSFASVRVHTGPAAAVAADELGARAFTIGDQIAFASGEYRPGTLVGDALLAHELAHTVQQRDAAGDGPATASVPPAAETVGAEELEADRSAVRAVMRLWNGVRADLVGWPRAVSQAMPRLRTGLRLRCCGKSKCCDPNAMPAPTGPLKIVEPDHDCNPLGEDRSDVFSVAKNPGGPLSHPTTYGVTERASAAWRRGVVYRQRECGPGGRVPSEVQAHSHSLRTSLGPEPVRVHQGRQVPGGIFERSPRAGAVGRRVKESPPSKSSPTNWLSRSGRPKSSTVRTFRRRGG